MKLMCWALVYYTHPWYAVLTTADKVLFLRTVGSGSGSASLLSEIGTESGVSA